MHKLPGTNGARILCTPLLHLCIIVFNIQKTNLVLLDYVPYAIVSVLNLDS